MKVLFLSPYPVEGASTRFRLVQYFDALEERGIRCRLSPFFGPRTFRIRRRFGPWFTLLKALGFAAGCLRRLADLARMPGMDAVVIHREAFPLGPPFYERWAARLAPRVVFDIDDADFSAAPTAVDQRALWRDPQKLPRMLPLFDRVLAGNHYLAGWIRDHQPRVDYAPTCVFVDALPEKIHRPAPAPVVGWIGNWGNTTYLAAVAAPLRELAAKIPFSLRLVGGPDVFDVRWPGVRIEPRLWTLDGETRDILEFDVGIMPLLGTEYDRGKCAFKLIQYSALGIPCVGSNVGANREAVLDGETGFLARSPADWTRSLEALLTDCTLRRRLGGAAREHMKKQFNARLLVDLWERTLHGGSS